MEEKFASKVKYYEVLGELVDWLNSRLDNTASSISGISSKLSESSDMEKWDKGIYERQLADSRLEMDALQDIKQAILSTFN